MLDINGYIIDDGTLVDYKGEDAVIDIPPVVNRIGGYVFSGRDFITSVTVPETVMSIDVKAFAHCEKLGFVNILNPDITLGCGVFNGCRGLADEKGFVVVCGHLYEYYGNDEVVVIPDSVTDIENTVFQGRRRIKEVIFPKNLRSIGAVVFDGCEGLCRIRIPNSVTVMGECVFHTCTSLLSVTLSESLTSIGDSAFYGCSKLSDISIPSSVTSIGEDAFSWCSSLRRVHIPDSVTSIGSRAFAKCLSLEDVNIPESAVNIGRGVFESCPCLVHDGGFTIVDGVLFGYIGDEEDIIIPDSVKRLSDDVFYRNTAISGITFPDTVTSIGKHVFGGGKKLVKLVLPRGYTQFKGTVLEQIWNQLYDSRLENVMIRSFLRQYPILLKKNLSLKRKIVCCRYDVVRYLIALDDDDALSELFGLFSKIPLEELNEYFEMSKHASNCIAFLMSYKAAHYTQRQQENAEKRRVEKALGLRDYTIADWKKIYDFERKDGGLIITGYKGKDTELVIPLRIGKYDVTGIGEKAFRMTFDISPDGRVTVFKPKLKSVVIPDTVTLISTNAFAFCTELEKVVIPPSVVNISSSAFHMCSRVCIYGTEDSYAKEYARENKIKFRTADVFGKGDESE